MSSIKKTLLPLIFLMVIHVGKSQEKEKKLPSSSPTVGASSSKTNKRLANTVEPDRKFSYAERELDYLMQIWEGEYDNVEQLDVDKIQGKQKHERVHASVRQFQNSNFGVGAVYVEEYRNDDPNNIVRQCIYQLFPDDEEKALRVKVFHFNVMEAILSINMNFESIASLTPDSNKLTPGCELILRREGNGFIAKSVDKSCVKSLKDNSYTVDYQFSVSENAFGFQDVLYDGKFRLEDARQITEYRLEKARCFTCMIDFPNDTNGRPTATKHYTDIYDQGGKFEFDYPDGRKMLLGMRNTWSFGMHRETFVIYIIDKATQQTLIYSWGTPGADRIGFNPGWIRVQCDIKTPRNVKLQLELRSDS